MQSPSYTCKVPFGQQAFGFTHLQIQSDVLTFTHLGIDGAELHRFAKKLDGSWA